MQFNFKSLVLFLSLIFFIFFLKVIKNKSFKPFYSFLWLSISLLMFSIIPLEKAYKGIATFIGITDASFLIIMKVIFFLLVYVFYLTVKISEMSDRMQELISFTAILDKKIRDYDDSK